MSRVVHQTESGEGGDPGPIVQAMLSGVERVVLFGEETLDMEAMAEYSGQGVCREVELRGDAVARYRE